MAKVEKANNGIKVVANKNTERGCGFINIFAPQKIVIGGGISESGQFYIDMIKETAFKYAMPDCSVNTDIVSATLGNKAGCLGAAMLVFND